MNRVESAKYLKSIPLFSQLSEEERLSLIESAHLLNRKAKRILIHEGEILSNLYLLMKGKAILYYLRPDGKKAVIYHIGNDKVFSVEAALTGRRHQGIVEALEDATLLAFPVKPLRDMMSSNAAFANQVAHCAMEHALYLLELHKDFSFGAPARLSRYLFLRALESSKPYGEGVSFDLGLKKGALAEFLGITPETLSRLFSQLQNDEVIEVKGSKIIVNSVKNLVSLSEGLYQSQGE